MFSLGKRKLRSPLTTISNYLVGGYREDVVRCFLEECNERTRDNSHKLQQEEFQLDTKQPLFFSHSGRGSALEQSSREAAEPLSLEMLKIQPNKVWSNLI